MLLAPLFSLLLALTATATPYASRADAEAAARDFNPEDVERDVLAQRRAFAARDVPTTKSVINGTYVRASELNKCPVLKKRAVPTNAADVRIDDITTVAALGDSLTAAMFAKSTTPLQLLEYRGVSYFMGADKGAVTVHNLIQNYSPALKGGSVNKNIVTFCALGGPFCTPNIWGSVSGLNAAISGAHGSNLPFEADTYLVPNYPRKAAADGWTLLNVLIGPNDMCQYCTAADFGIGSAQEYANGIRTAVEKVRKIAPRLIVHVVGTFRVSDIFAKTYNDPWCKKPGLFQLLPHFSIECPCAVLPGPVGDYKRRKMDEVADAYDAAVRNVVRGWEAENDPKFGVARQPGRIVNIKNIPIQGFSPADCFHPSEMTHARMAANIFNRLHVNVDKKATETKWEDDIWVRCVEENDRIVVKGTTA